MYACAYVSEVGQSHIYIRFIYGVFGREITKHTVIYGIYIYIYDSGQLYVYIYSSMYM